MLVAHQKILELGISAVVCGDVMNVVPNVSKTCSRVSYRGVCNDVHRLIDTAAEHIWR